MESILIASIGSVSGASEAPLAVSGNIRAWRDVLFKRYHIAADKEIQQFAVKVLQHLRDVAPHCAQNITEVRR